MPNIRDIIEAAKAKYPSLRNDGCWICYGDDECCEAPCATTDDSYLPNGSGEFHGREVLAPFIATFDPEHVALMEAVIQASDDDFPDWGESPFTRAIKALDAYRKERGYSGQ